MIPPNDQEQQSAQSYRGYLESPRSALLQLPAAGMFSGCAIRAAMQLVVAEAHALTFNRRDRELAARFLAGMEESQGTMILRARAADEQQARHFIARYGDKDLSLTDTISFAMMDCLGIHYAFTFDHHFAQYGLRVLWPDTFSRS